MNMNDLNNLHIPTLADRAMLVRLSRSQYQPYAHDLGATMKIEVDTGVRKAGRFNKRLLLDCHMLRDTNVAFNDVYQYHMRNTAPWLDDGMRVLPSKSYFDYSQAMSELMATARRKVDELAVVWDQLVIEDMQRLGPLARSEDYPKDIRSKYSVGLKFLPIPTASDFRVHISDEDKATLASAISEAESGVTRHLLAEMLEPVKRAVEKLSVPIGAEGSIFRDSLLSNLIEVADRAKKLNVMDDLAVETIIDAINANVKGYVQNPDRLREDVAARSDAQAQLDEIMNKMSAFMGGA